jgi:transcription elongation factor GreA
MKIGKLEHLLSRVKIIEPEDIPSGEVYILTDTKVKDAKTGEIITFTLVSPDEADFELDKISVFSPLGKALLGKKAGEIARVEVPAGTIEYEIIEIKK